MPAPSPIRQVGVSPWFETESACALLRAERQLALEALRRRPSQPWLWLSAGLAGWPELGALPGRGLRLRQSDDRAGYDGDVRCGLPLPLPSESLGAIVAQHLCVVDVDQWLDECTRVLAPGGRIWLFTLNPLSPYRLHWRGQAMSRWRPERWRRALRRAGLHCPAQAQRFLGPTWKLHDIGHAAADRLPWRAVCLFEAEKRGAAPVRPVPLPAKVRWRRKVITI